MYWLRTAQTHLAKIKPSMAGISHTISRPNCFSPHKTRRVLLLSCTKTLYGLAMITSSRTIPGGPSHTPSTGAAGYPLQPTCNCANVPGDTRWPGLNMGAHSPAATPRGPKRLCPLPMCPPTSYLFLHRHRAGAGPPARDTLPQCPGLMFLNSSCKPWVWPLRPPPSPLPPLGARSQSWALLMTFGNSSDPLDPSAGK